MLTVVNGQLTYVTQGDEVMFNNPTINPTVSDPSSLAASISAKASKATAHIIPGEEVTGETNDEGEITGGNTVFTIAGKKADLTQNPECYNGGFRVFNFTAENVGDDAVFTFDSAPLAGNDLIIIYPEL